MALSNADNPVAEAKPARRLIRTDPGPAAEPEPVDTQPEPEPVAPDVPDARLRRASEASNPDVHRLLANRIAHAGAGNAAEVALIDAELAELGYAV